MLRSFPAIFIATATTACVDHQVDDGCDRHATVKNLTGLDGCGFVFELGNGSRLEPILMGEEPLRSNLSMAKMLLLVMRKYHRVVFVWSAKL